MNLAAAATVAGLFLILDASFFLANLAKVADGGYVPLLLALAVYGVMWIWHRGATAVTEKIHKSLIPIPEFIASLQSDRIRRVPGTAVFLTRTETDTPPVMAWHVRHNRALHEHLFVLRVQVLPVPWIAPESRLNISEMAPNFWRAIARYGFMEQPDIPALLRSSQALGCTVDLDDITYYVGHETVIHRPGDGSLPAWQEKLFAMMERNAVHVSDFLGLPSDQVVEIGRQIAI